MDTSRACTGWYNGELNSELPCADKRRRVADCHLASGWGPKPSHLSSRSRSWTLPFSKLDSESSTHFADLSLAQEELAQAQEALTDDNVYDAKATQVRMKPQA